MAGQVEASHRLAREVLVLAVLQLPPRRLRELRRGGGVDAAHDQPAAHQPRNLKELPHRRLGGPCLPEDLRHNALAAGPSAGGANRVREGWRSDERARFEGGGATIIVAITSPWA